MPYIPITRHPRPDVIPLLQGDLTENDIAQIEETLLNAGIDTSRIRICLRLGYVDFLWRRPPRQPNAIHDDDLNDAMSHALDTAGWQLRGPDGPHHTPGEPPAVIGHPTTEGPELWTVEQAAEYMGVQPGSARGTLSRWSVPAYDYEQTAPGRQRALYLALAVRGAYRHRPRGARTDRRNSRS